MKNKKINQSKRKKLLVGNKTDLRKKGDKATTEKIMSLLKEILEKYPGKVKIKECSALENQNINQVFEEIAREIYQEQAFEAYEKNNEENDSKRPKIDTSHQPIKKPTKKASSGGILNCGSRGRKDDDDDDDENTEPVAAEDDPIRELPNFATSSNNNCNVF